MRFLIPCFLTMVFAAAPISALGIGPELDPRSKGVMVYDRVEVVDDKPGEIDFYRKDGTLLRHVNLGVGNLDTQFPAAVTFNMDYDLIVLDCVAETETHYAVVLNRQSRELGYIRKSDPRFHFESWPKYITGLFAVGFDPAANPLRRAADESAAIIPAPDDFLHPEEVRGDWLRVKWGTEGKKGSGWIRWRSGKEFLIDMFNIA